MMIIKARPSQQLGAVLQTPVLLGIRISPEDFFLMPLTSFIYTRFIENSGILI